MKTTAEAGNEYKGAEMKMKRNLSTIITGLLAATALTVQGFTLDKDEVVPNEDQLNINN